MDRFLLTQTFYQTRLNEIKESNQNELMAKKVGWQSYENQLLTFDIATNLYGINWTEVNSILDIGCGYGNLVECLRKQHNYQGKYTGIDIISNFIEDAKKLYGCDPRNQFIVGDFLNEYREKQNYYDVIFCLGALSINHDQPDFYGKLSQQYAEDLIATISKLALSAIVLYFPNGENVPILQKYVNWDMAFYKPIDIEKMLRFYTDKRLKNLEIQSYPNPHDIKTIVKVFLKTDQD